MLLKALPVVRILVLVFVVFALSIVYTYGQTLLHSRGWWEVVRMQGVITWVVVGIALAVIGFYVWLEIWAQRQNDVERNKTNRLLEAIAHKVGVDTDEVSTTDKSKSESGDKYEQSG